MRETALLPPIRRLFPPQRFALKTEVPFHRKSIDALFLDRRTRRLVAIELKVEKWRKALRQAAVYQLCAHRVYVALWHRHLNPQNTALIASYGLGVIEISPGPRRQKVARIVAAPGRRSLTSRHYVRDLRDRFA